MSDRRIRLATKEDIPAIKAIYNPYILNTAITFEYEPVSEEELGKRMEIVGQQFPWLVCEINHQVVGYAYCSKFKERAAFGWDCESSVYVDQKYHGKGIATMLYEKLFELVKEQGYYTVYALITYPHDSSVALHKKFGFTEVGIYRNTGFKMGQWWDLIVMEKRLKSFESIPEKPKLLHEISDLE